MAVTANVRLPGLLDAGLNEIDRLHPTAASLSLNLGGTNEATITLPEGSPAVPIHAWVSIYTQNGLNGIYRVTNAQRTYKRQTQLTLLHGIDILSDSVWEAQTEFTGTTTQFLTALLNQQTQLINGVKPWVLGTCEDSQTVKRTINYDRLSNLLESLTEEGGQYFFEYDQSVWPWRINYLHKSGTAVSEFRLARNVRSASVTYNDADLCTRLVLSVNVKKGEEIPYFDEDYYMAAAEAEEGETIDVPTTTITSTDTAIRVYDNLAAQANWGVVVKTADIDTDDTIGKTPASSSFPRADAWAQAFLAKRSAPSVQIQIDGDELGAITGDSWDELSIGRMCLVTLPEYGPQVFLERVVSVSYDDFLGAPGHVSVSLANTLPRFSESIASAQKEAARASASARATAREKADAKEVTEWAQKVQHYGEALDGSGIMTLYETGIDMSATDGVTIYSLQQGVQALYSAIKVNTENISTVVGTVGGMQSQITQTADAISLLVTTGTGQDGQTTHTVNAGIIIKAINGGGNDASEITISADKIALDGTTIVNLLEGGALDVYSVTAYEVNSVDFGIWDPLEEEVTPLGLKTTTIGNGSDPQSITFLGSSSATQAETITYQDFPHYHTVTFDNATGQITIGGVTSTAPDPFDLTRTAWYAGQIAGARSSVAVNGVTWNTPHSSQNQSKPHGMYYSISGTVQLAYQSGVDGQGDPVYTAVGNPVSIGPQEITGVYDAGYEDALAAVTPYPQSWDYDDTNDVYTLSVQARAGSTVIFTEPVELPSFSGTWTQGGTDFRHQATVRVSSSQLPDNYDGYQAVYEATGTLSADSATVSGQKSRGWKLDSSGNNTWHKDVLFRVSGTTYAALDFDATEAYNAGQAAPSASDYKRGQQSIKATAPGYSSTGGFSSSTGLAVSVVSNCESNDASYPYTDSISGTIRVPISIVVSNAGVDAGNAMNHRARVGIYKPTADGGYQRIDGLSKLIELTYNESTGRLVTADSNGAPVYQITVTGNNNGTAYATRTFNVTPTEAIRYGMQQVEWANPSWSGSTLSIGTTGRLDANGANDNLTETVTLAAGWHYGENGSTEPNAPTDKAYYKVTSKIGNNTAYSRFVTQLTGSVALGGSGFVWIGNANHPNAHQYSYYLAGTVSEVKNGNSTTILTAGSGTGTSPLYLEPTEAIRYGTSLVTNGDPTWIGADGDSNGEHALSYKLTTSGRKNANGGANEDVDYLAATDAINYGKSQVSLARSAFEWKSSGANANTYMVKTAGRTTASGTVNEDVAYLPVSVSAVGLTSGSFVCDKDSTYAGSCPITGSSGGVVTINGADTVTAPVTQLNLAVSLNSPSSSNLAWHTEEGNYQYKYTYTVSATANVGGTNNVLSRTSGTVSFSPTSAINYGKTLVVVTSVARVSDCAFDKENETAQQTVRVTLSNGETFDMTADLSDAYKAGLNGEAQVSQLDFEIELKDKAGNFVKDVPWTLTGLSDVWQQGRDDATVYYVRVRSGPLYFRKSASTSAAAWGRLKTDTYCRLLEDNSVRDSTGWAHVYYDGYEGYLSNNYLYKSVYTSDPGTGGWVGSAPSDDPGGDTPTGKVVGRVHFDYTVYNKVADMQLTVTDKGGHTHTITSYYNPSAFDNLGNATVSTSDALKADGQGNYAYHLSSVSTNASIQHKSYVRLEYTSASYPDENKVLSFTSKMRDYIPNNYPVVN